MNSDSSTKTARQLVEELLTPCRQCGKPQRYQIDEFCSPEQWLQNLEVLREENPVRYEQIVSMESYCDACMAEMVQKNRAQADQERAAKIRRDAYGKGLVPEIAVHATFEKSDRAIESRHSAYWLQAREWHARDENAWITGYSGSGKTYMARCIVNRFFDHGLTCAEISGLELASMVRRFDWLETIKPYIVPRLLLIDDIDKALWSKEQLEILWHLLDKRLGRGRRLIVTANVSPEHFRESLERNRPENKSIAGTIFRRMLPEGGKSKTLRWELVNRG